MNDNFKINGTVVRIETNAATKTFPKIECGSIFMALDGCLYVKIQKLVSKAPSRKCFNAVVSSRYIKHVTHRKLPEDLKFLYDISDRLSHVRVDYVISGERWGTTIGYHKLLTQVLDSDNLSAVIERCVNAGVFAEDKIFFNELEYFARRRLAIETSAEIRFYRV